MDPKNLDTYLYVEKTPVWLIRSIYLVGILTWIGVIYGYYRFISVNLLFFCIVAPAVGFIILYHLISYAINLFYKRFDLVAHSALVAKYDFSKKTPLAETPSVDVFLPICGEDSEVVKRTFQAVLELNYPKRRLKVYVLDDKGLEEHKKLSKTFNFKYLSRKDKGRMKKSGNIRYGYERSKGAFIVILDADFAPNPDFIRELLPYMISNPKAGIVQSPQYFQTDKEVHKRSALEYGAAHVQEDFYRIIQVARDQLGSPICCGSNAIYRREALDAIGGTIQIEHSEDMYTGFELCNQGWQVRYIPLILAVGYCPDGLHQYFHQQHRWCSGSMTLMLDKRFWNSKLSFSQKMCFISGYMYYLSHPITILLSFQVFFLLFLYHDYINLWNTLPFLPCILFSFVAIPLLRITKQRYGGFLAQNVNAYSYSHASILAFLKSSVGWQPTNTKTLDVSKAFMQQLVFIAGYFALYVSFVGYAIGRDEFKIFNLNYYSLLFWIFYNFVTTSLLLSQLYLVLDDIQREQVLDGRKASRSLLWWRLKTIGGYAVFVSSAFCLALVF